MSTVLRLVEQKEPWVGWSPLAGWTDSGSALILPCTDSPWYALTATKDKRCLSASSTTNNTQRVSHSVRDATSHPTITDVS